MQQKSSENQQKSSEGKGPVIISGDFNARIQKATSSREKRLIGTHTFEPETASTYPRGEGAENNRNHLIVFVMNMN